MTASVELVHRARCFVCGRSFTMQLLHCHIATVPYQQSLIFYSKYTPSRTVRYVLTSHAFLDGMMILSNSFCNCSKGSHRVCHAFADLALQRPPVGVEVEGKTQAFRL